MQNSMILSAILFATSACSSDYEPPRVVERWDDTAPKPRDGVTLVKAMLSVHNKARKDVGFPALTWDNALAADAGDYAAVLSRTNKFEHAKQSPDKPFQGENLWMGTTGAYSFEEMAQGWVDEIRYFKRGLMPDLSTTGKWQDVGHYTQIIWRTNTKFGCAVSGNKRYEYLVCRYSPGGNIVGRDPLKG